VARHIRLSAHALLAALLAALAACGSRHLVASVATPGTHSGGFQAPPSAPVPPDHRRHSRPVGPRPARTILLAGPLRAAAAGEELASSLLGLVGRRDDRSTAVGFALSALTGLGVPLDPPLLGVDDGATLRDLAAERGALAPAARPRLGDLLLFDAGEPASVVAVAVSFDARGVIEFVYLSRGVVRRGTMSPDRPHGKRDADGRALNTFLRHSDGDLPRGAPALAGELFAARIQLDRLLRTPAREARHGAPARAAPCYASLARGSGGAGRRMGLKTPGPKGRESSTLSCPTDGSIMPLAPRVDRRRPRGCGRARRG
jgi:hypothetical protein